MFAMILKNINILTFFFIIALTSCADNEIYILDESQVDKIQKLFNKFDENQYVRFNSVGGRVSTSLEIAQLVQRNEIKIEIDNLCLSNCAEIILPSASYVKFVNSPIIGFHGNFSSYRHYVEISDIDQKEFCNWGRDIELTALLSENNMNVGFWSEQMKRLKPNVTFIHQPNKCPWRVYNFENHMWLPTSEQLKSLWGLQFSGSVCADDFEKCSKRVNRRWKKGTRIVIGDEVYVSKGR